MYAPNELDTTSRDNVRDFGEIFTPTSIVDKMLDLIPVGAWKDPFFCFLEPTSGNGQFLVRIFDRRLKHGISIEDALNTLIGMELNPDTLLDSHVRLYEMVCDRMVGWTKSERLKVAKRVVAIVRNNIFQVEDSLEYLGDPLSKRKFFFADPTGNGQVLTKNQRDMVLWKIEKEFKDYSVGDKKHRDLAPFFSRGYGRNR